MSVETLLPIGILLVLSLCVCGAILGLTSLLGPKNPVASKLSTYECGVPPEGSARAPFQIRFYHIAVLFLLFDVEAAFFFPWALVYRESLVSGATLLLAIVIYLFLMVLGLIYILRKGSLNLT